MSALAKLALTWGHRVSGSDRSYSKNVEELVEWGASVYVGENERTVLDADLIVYSGAIKRNHPEYQIALRGGKKMISREYFLFEVSKVFDKTIAVAGTHGKTTATAMISKILCEYGTAFTAHVGGKTELGNLIYKGEEVFLTEACEYNRSFLALEPDIALVLNVEMDHPDTYSNEDELISSFLSFASNVKEGGTLILNADSQYYDILKSTYKDMLTYAIENTADLTATNIINYGNGEYGFRIKQKGHPNCDIRLNVPGYHNVYNALSAFACAVTLGVDRDVARRGIEKFKGVLGRFEFLGERHGVRFYRDYAHHPTEIKSTLKTAREKMHGYGRLITIFQPHTRSRTESLFDEFVLALLESDETFFLKEYLARQEEGGKSAYELFLKAKEGGANVRYYNTEIELVRDVLGEIQRGDVVLILGAGDVAEIGALLLK